MRNYRFDNIKFILIVLVVLGHFLELQVNSDTAKAVYRVIYLFHIPAFVFTSGYFAKFNPKKILRSFIFPYIIFQPIYLLFHHLLILEEETVTLRFAKPYWILWYLIAMAYYYLLIPFFETQDIRKQFKSLFAAIIVSLAVGYELSIHYTMTLSRFFVFLPYFLAGYYFHSNYDLLIEKWKSLPWLRNFTYIVALAGVIYSTYFIVHRQLSSYILYGSLPYAKLDYNPYIRLQLLFFASSWIIILFRIVPNKKIPILSTIGKHTFWIFILHGFIIELIGKYVFNVIL